MKRRDLRLLWAVNNPDRPFENGRRKRPQTLDEARAYVEHHVATQLRDRPWKTLWVYVVKGFILDEDVSSITLYDTPITMRGNQPIASGEWPEVWDHFVFHGGMLHG